MLAVGLNDGLVTIWDFSTRQIAKTLAAHCHPITSICWSKNGHQILTTSTDKLMAIWDVLSGDCQFRCTFPSPVLFAQFNPSNSFQILAMPLYEGPVLLKIDENGQNSYECFPLFMNGRLITSAKFDNTGDHIYLGNANSLILICETKTRKMVTAFQVNVSNLFTTNSIQNIEFSKNNQLVMVNASDYLIRVYKTEEILASKWIDDTNEQQQQQHIFQTFQDAVTRSSWKNCCFSADDQYVCAGSLRQHKLYIWETINGSLIKILHDCDRKEFFLDLAWHPISSTVISISSGILSIWTPRYLENISEFTPGFSEIDTNEVYEERESEFDITDEDKSIVNEDISKENTDELDEIDVESFDNPFPDKEQISDYLIFIPETPIIISDNVVEFEKNEENQQQINPTIINIEKEQQADSTNDFIDILN